MHVLISDRVAEHLPGCNMAFRRAALKSVGGFDEIYRVAGDDVDLCWRLQERGMTLAFAPAAVVWHHLRDSLAGYLGQQRGYGRAEALLEQRWPANYQPMVQVSWSGRIYSQPQHLDWAATRRIYHGIWGTAAFQPRQAGPGSLLTAGSAPEWYLILVTLAALSF